MVCPYVRRARARTLMQNDDPMHVIWHNDKRAQFNLWVMSGNGAPAFVHDLAHIRKLHFTIDDLAGQTHASLRDDGNEISALRAVIKSFDSDGAPMVFARVVFHL